MSDHDRMLFYQMKRLGTTGMRPDRWTSLWFRPNTIILNKVARQRHIHWALPHRWVLCYVNSRIQLPLCYCELILIGGSALTGWQVEVVCRRMRGTLTCWVLLQCWISSSHGMCAHPKGVCSSKTPAESLLNMGLHCFKDYHTRDLRLVWSDSDVNSEGALSYCH